MDKTQEKKHTRALIIVIVIALTLGIFIGYKKAVKFGYVKYGVKTMQKDAMLAPIPEQKDAMLAPIPEIAGGATIDQEKGYVIEELGEGLYWVTDGTYQVMFLTTGEGVIALDAPPSMMDKYLAAIAETTEESITHVIYSHSHADHISGAAKFPEGATYIAHEDAATQIERGISSTREFPFGAFLGGEPVPAPTQTFSDEMTLRVGTQILELSYKGPAHEPGNIYVYAPEHKVLYVIDVIFPGWSPFMGLAVAEDVPAYIDAHDIILDYDFEKIITGHVGRYGTRMDVETQKEYIGSITGAAAAALQTVDFMAIAQEVGFSNPWALFDKYLKTLDQSCTEAVEAIWVGRLGAVDVFTESHCARIIESLRID